MEPIEVIREQAVSAVPGAEIDVVLNTAPSAQHSLRVDRGHVVEVARFLREDPALRLDYCSNVTGVDWLDRTSKVKVRRIEGDLEKEVEENQTLPGYIEVVYHLYSMARKHGPLVLRVRTGDRSGDVFVPSLTPIWRSCEFQEREIFDLYGVHFDGHPDPRRLLMWEGFTDHPMRKDYVEPDDYEYEPTPHDRVLERAKEHAAKTAEK
jgi:NADH-quinone oxidoreductase subunit C